MFGSGTDTTATTATGNNNIDGLMTSERWADPNITYSFTDNFGNDYESGYPDSSVHSTSFQTFNTAQRTVMRNWAKAYYDISFVDLSEQTGANDRNATIRIGMSNDPPTGYAYTPGFPVEGGDIFFNRIYFNTPVMGNYAYIGLGHELGHALGLKHPHEADGVRNVTMNADRDSHEFSIMSYRSYIGASTDGGVTNETYGSPQSLMMYDIRAIQQEYGAWFGSNATNSTYTFSTTTGEMFINGVGQGTPGANRIFRTIWDGNGADTYNFSNYSTNLSIDLTPGGWSDLAVGSNFQRANLDQFSSAHYARGHVFNALQYNGDTRSLIENANGGSGNDRITGNIANNTLNGGAGNDNLNGGAGNDTLNGGLGNDIINGGIGIDKMTGGTGNDIYYIDNVDDIITESSTIPTEIDTVYASISNTLVLNVERLTLTGTGAINGSGNNLSNIVVGNNAANTLYGDAGSDILNGGLGADRFLFKRKTDGIDLIDFKSAEGDKIVISASGFGGGLVAGQAIAASQLLVSAGSAATNTSQRLIYNSGSGGLFFDVDGLGGTGAFQFATLSAHPTTLSTTSFVIA